jgi:NAD(P)-dependent dehydrogenase (short-subunit alcohol dehydrogenase family)
MVEHVVDRSLQEKVALVAGATRGAGRAIAVELCRAGAFVYATGRSSRLTGPSDMGRLENHRGNQRADAGDRR